MHQSFEPLTPHPTPLHTWRGHSLSLSASVKASEVPGHQDKDTEWINVPTPWYSAVQLNQVPCVESAVTAFLNALTRPWRAFLKEENVNVSYANNLCQMFKLPSGAKMWPLTSVKKFAWFSDGLKSPAPSLSQTTSSRLKIRLKNWKWVFTPPPNETQAGKYEVIIMWIYEYPFVWFFSMYLISIFLTMASHEFTFCF